mmetsp:Transcript_27820/g.42105  ORF Transcript_27820/g.42105 Transcript_27820/m.42105 type:complete len:141 (-) Transcript_27820:36-458(-)
MKRYSETLLKNDAEARETGTTTRGEGAEEMKTTLADVSLSMNHLIAKSNMTTKKSRIITLPKNDTEVEIAKTMIRGEAMGKMKANLADDDAITTTLSSKILLRNGVEEGMKETTTHGKVMEGMKTILADVRASMNLPIAK